MILRPRQMPPFLLSLTGWSSGTSNQPGLRGPKRQSSL
jgi:hypothetical protein